MLPDHDFLAFRNPGRGGQLLPWRNEAHTASLRSVCSLHRPLWSVDKRHPLIGSSPVPASSNRLVPLAFECVARRESFPKSRSQCSEVARSLYEHSAYGGNDFSRRGNEGKHAQVTLRLNGRLTCLPFSLVRALWLGGSRRVSRVSEFAEGSLSLAL